MDNLVKKFYSSGVNVGAGFDRPNYETRTNFFANNTNTTNTNYMAMKTTQPQQPMYFSANDLSSITDKMLNSNKFNINGEVILINYPLERPCQEVDPHGGKAEKFGK